MIVKIKRANNSVPLPRYATAGAAGCDIHTSEKTLVPAGGTTIVPTGLFLEIPKGYECQVRSRSGLAAKLGVTVLNSPGTIDSDYRGEVKVIMHNTSKIDCELEKGDRIAQLVFAPVIQVEFDLNEVLTDTERGAGGFGSTGRK